jgi:hypothetical protein
VGFLCQSEGVIGVFQCSLRMPPSSFIIAFFIMLGGGSMSARGELVLLGRFPVCVLHWCFLLLEY